MKISTLLPIALCAAIPLSASAAFFQAEETVSISLPVQDDIYIAGGEVRVTEPIAGDAIVVGGDVLFTSSVEQDLTVAGGDITIQGTVRDDARIFSATVDITGSVGDDVFILGGEVDIRTSSVITGDVHIVGGDITIDGEILGNLYVDAATLTVNGNVRGSIDVSAETIIINAEVSGDTIASAKNLTFTKTSTFGGNVNYWQPNKQYTFEDGQVQGITTYDESLSSYKVEGTKKETIGLFVFGMFSYSLFSSALVILLCILLTKSYFIDAAKKLLKEPGMSVWFGFLYLIVTPFLALVFLLTFIGLPIGLLIGMSYLFTFYFIKPMTAIVLAQALRLHYKKKWGTTKLFFVSIGLLFVWKILLFVPVLGILFSSLLVLAGFGTLAQTEWLKFKKVR